MTISKPTDIREFWITEDMESVKFERGATAGMAFDHKQSDDEEYVHVIEYRAVEKLKAAGRKLSRDVDNLIQERGKLREQVKDYEQALKDWIDFENESIKKDGPYVGDKINKIILQAGEVLKKWSGV